MRKPNPNRNYFTKETEEWIIKYNNTADQAVRNKIFTEHLYYPFYKLAENIIHTFKFYHTDVNQLEDLKLDIVTMLWNEKIHLFDPSRGAKAYSYFGTIVKRWLIAYSNTNYRKLKKQVEIPEYDTQIEDTAAVDPSAEISTTMSLSGFMDNWIADVYSKLEILFHKESDRKIADAVLTVFRTRHSLEVFKKKALYIYVREITGCETAFLTKVVLKLKENFYSKYKDYLAKGLIQIESDEDLYLL